MNTLNKFFSAAAAVAVLSSSFLAGNLASADPVGKTREQVTAELAQARASGALDAMNSDNGFAFLQRATSKAAPAKTRAQVLAELKQARESGELAAINSDDSMATYRFAAKQAAKRTETLAE